MPGSHRTVGEPTSCAVSIPFRYIASAASRSAGSVDEIAGLFQSTPKSSGMLTTRECALSSRALKSRMSDGSAGRRCGRTISTLWTW